MKRITAKEVLEKLETRRASGSHVDSRVFDAVGKSKELHIITVTDKDEFLSLIWQEISKHAIITPGGLSNPRTLKDVANRMIKQDLSFEALVSGEAKPRDMYEPEWFRPCLDIVSAGFDYSLFGWVVVVPANESERRQSPCGEFYIYDGVHKTLVLSNLLLANKIEFQPIDLLLLQPRPL